MTGSTVTALRPSPSIHSRTARIALAAAILVSGAHIAGAPKLDVFTYDVGAEARAPQWFAGQAVTVNAFAGGGAGGRSYNYRNLDVDATRNVAAYVAVGGDVGIRRVHVRVEVRDYVGGFTPLAGGGHGATRNDVVVMAGLRFSGR
jgi:hypothetical protein